MRSLRPARASRKPKYVFADIEHEIRDVIPAREIDTIIDNIGIPNSGFNLAFGDSATIGTGDGEILISLNEDDHGPTADYTEPAAQAAAPEISRTCCSSSSRRTSRIRF